MDDTNEAQKMHHRLHDTLEPPETNKVNELDFIIENTVHANCAAVVGEALKQIKIPNIKQLRLVTVKILVIYYLQQVMETDRKNCLIDALSCFEKLFKFDNEMKKTDEYIGLVYSVKYQIIHHHLHSCGSESALLFVNRYFPKSSKIIKEQKCREKCMSNIAAHGRGNTYNFVEWPRFKDFGIKQCQSIISMNGPSAITQINEIRKRNMTDDSTNSPNTNKSKRKDNSKVQLI